MDELEVEVVVEVPAGSRNRYVYDHVRHVFRLGWRVPGEPCPADYGFVPETLTRSGTPLAALVLLEEPSFPGCRVIGRPVAVVWLSGAGGPDATIVCLPSHEPRWQGVRDPDQLPSEQRADVARFLASDRSCAPVREAPVREAPVREAPVREAPVGGAEERAALAEIRACRERFAATGPARRWVEYP